MEKQHKICVTSPSFSKNEILRKELTALFPNSVFNEDGKKYTSEELIETAGKDINLAFVIVVGILLIYFFKEIFKYYWENMKPMEDQEKRLLEELNKEKGKKQANEKELTTKLPSLLTPLLTPPSIFEMIQNINDRITYMVENYSGKYVLKSELQELKSDLKQLTEKLEKTREDLSNLKGKLEKNK